MDFAEFSKIWDHVNTWILLSANVVTATIALMIIVTKPSSKAFAVFFVLASVFLAIGLSGQLLFLNHKELPLVAAQWRLIFIVRAASQTLGAILAVMAMVSLYKFMTSVEKERNLGQKINR